MKTNLLILTAVVCAIPNMVNAAITKPTTCEDKGLTPGDTCWSGNPSNTITDSECTDSGRGCTLHSCSNGCVCVTSITPGECYSDNNWCATCPNSNWTDYGAEYQTRCSKAKCEYQCAAGYYGTATNSGTDASPSLSGCTRCPSSGGITGTSIAGSNSAITSCYIPAGTSFSDSTGNGTYTNDCYWTE